MRFLWVEDFGDDSEDQSDKQERWEKYFAIEDNILQYTLEDALSYLDDTDNKSRFDVVLLDIRFPVLKGESEKDEETLYKNYFSSFITEDVFNKYASSEVMKDASSGILLFLALIFRYGYNWNNIAFISANIDNDDLNDINILKELMAKIESKAAFSNKDIALYKTKYHDLFLEEDSLVNTKLGNSYEKIEIPTYEELVSISNLEEKVRKEEMAREIKKLETIQEMLNEKIFIENSRGLKYCSVRNQFRQIGLKMPPAFEKPTDESQDICWLFRRWINSKPKREIMIKRSIINASRLLLDILDKPDRNSDESVRRFLSKQRRYNDPGSIVTKGTIKQYFQNIIRYAADFPEIETGKNKDLYAANLVESVVSIWESIIRPGVDGRKKETYYEAAYYSVMKLTRNWMAHQGIAGIDIKFAAFAFVISVKGIFELEKTSSSERDKIHKEVQNLINLFACSSVSYRQLDVGTLMEYEYQRMSDRVKKAITADKSGTKGKMKVPEKKDPHLLISALGHEESGSRSKVSVAEIYKVFWLICYFGDGDSGILDPGKNDDAEVISILENIYPF